MNFTCADIENFMAALSDHIVDKRKEDLLPLIFAEWARVELTSYFQQPPPKETRAEQKQLQKLAAVANELAQLISDLSPDIRYAVAGRQIGGFVALEPGSSVFVPRDGTTHAQLLEADGHLAEERDRLRDIAAAAAETAAVWKPLPLRPSTTLRYLVLRDLAALFEYATGETASRKILVDPHEDAGSEYGPFFALTCAIWPVVFGSLHGLGFALQWWAKTRAKYGERSRIITSISLRHPEWRIFER
jgi:hypothetical protein